ncbi:hypothetical protein J7443_17655 [Tropicibacter sp. R15_0]|uniref:hypothetical protein n=1 Tax=Tropicibacter sp. R15_0 TaxID=2821101 RepID=UPI001ADB25C9|nr:hypothetical protein [Tropicibacter sp. R15_0]MBO9467074.1 hypothetical protein [Tropicibacter sp. R15_0]
MSKLTDLAAAVGRAIAPLPFTVSVIVSENTEQLEIGNGVKANPSAKVDHVTLVARLSAIMGNWLDGYHLHVTCPDVEFVFSMVPGGAILVGDGPVYHGETIDLSSEVPRLTMRRISPGGWCHKTSVGVYYYGSGTFDFVGEGREMFTQEALWKNGVRPCSSDRAIDGLGPRTTGAVFAIFD